MNKDAFAGNWTQIRGRVREWWGNLTDDELNRVEGKRDRLVGLVQKKYGYTKAQVETELDHHLSEYERIDQPYTAAYSRVSGLTPDRPAASPSHPRVMAVGTFTGSRVINPVGEDLGQIEDMVVDLESGRIAYAVLSFGGFLGFGNKLFAIPWEALKLSSQDDEFILHVHKEALANAPGFDKDHWPEMADRQWGAGIYSYYGYRPYWAEDSLP
jgi:uncharacterized protein YjbJ (UPF0337 family)/sporulation protein YlmC with PRC-barrel domain